MADYYIRTPDREESRGSFDASRLSTLAEAVQITETSRHLKKKEASLQKSTALSNSSIGLMMMLSAVFLLAPHFSTINEAISAGKISTIFNYPFIVVGLFDFIMAALLFLSVTEIYPLLRGRAMLTLGFGIYVGWALGDPIILIASAAAGLGIFYATIAQSLTTMLVAMALGIGGNATLAYLAILGHFAGFFDSMYFKLIPSG
ncbi:MAG: hypothetical protein ACI9FZ_000156 [Bacteroidia bacterium]|jgi:hypothetical protein